MKQTALSIIFTFVLTMGILSCSHRSGILFLDRLGINTDSVLFDSLPNSFFSDSIGNVLTREQCDSLNTFYYHTKIVSVKQIGDNYLLTFLSHREGMFSILYDKKGKVLDQVHQLAVYYRSKGQKDSIDMGIIKVAKEIKTPGIVSFRDFNWERHFVDSDKFEVTGRIQKTDSIIRYLYKVSGKKITQIKKTVTHNMRTSHHDDICSLPVSQTYLACDLLNDIPNEPRAHYEGCRIISYTWLESFVYYNTPAILKWIVDHRGNNDYVFYNLYGFNLFNIFYDDGTNEYKKSFPKDYIRKQIMQMSNKSDREYILKLFADEDAEREAELKKYQ